MLFFIKKKSSACVSVGKGACASYGIGIKGFSI